MASVAAVSDVASADCPADCDGHLSARGPETPRAQTGSRGQRLPLPIHECHSRGQMVPGSLLMCLFFRRQLFLRCLLGELAPPLCHNISSKLHLGKGKKAKKTQPK